MEETQQPAMLQNDHPVELEISLAEANMILQEIDNAPLGQVKTFFEQQSSALLEAFSKIPADKLDAMATVKFTAYSLDFLRARIANNRSWAAANRFMLASTAVLQEELSKAQLNSAVN